MVDYIHINPTEYEPEAPLTSSLAARMVNNPIAIAEGAPGAPRVQPAGLSAPLWALIQASSGLHVSVPFDETVGSGGFVPSDGRHAVYLFHAGTDTRGQWTDVHLVESRDLVPAMGPSFKQPITFHNASGTALLVHVKAVVYRDANDGPIQVRLLRNGVVQQTVGPDPGAQTINFNAISVAAGASAYFGLQGIVGTGSGQDRIELQQLYAWLSVP